MIHVRVIQYRNFPLQWSSKKEPLENQKSQVSSSQKAVFSLQVSHWKRSNKMDYLIHCIHPNKWTVVTHVKADHISIKLMD